MLTSFIIQLGSASCHKHGGIFQDRDFDGSISFRFSGKLTPARTLLVHWISDTSKLALARNTEKETDGRSIAIWCQITRAKGKVKAGKQDFRLVRTSSVRFETFERKFSNSSWPISLKLRDLLLWTVKLIEGRREGGIVGTPFPSARSKR